MIINNEKYIVIVESNNYDWKTVLARKISDNLYYVLRITHTGKISFIKENIKSFNDAKEIFYKYEG